MTTNSPSPKRGDIWLANFDPTVGAEIKKIRPSVVVSSDCVGKLPLKLAAPITDWKEYYSGNIWHVKIEPDIAKFCLNVNKHRKQQERLSSISLLFSCDIRRA